MGVPELKLFKISNGALKGESLPKRLKILSWGENSTADGPVKIGQKTVEGIAAQGKTGFQRVALDFDHCTVETTSTYKELLGAGQPPLIFGYGRPSVFKDDGLYLEDMVYTPLGLQHARNFEDLSPAMLDKDNDGELTFLHSVALTPNGKVNGLQFFKAEMTTADAGAEADDATDAATEASGKAMESGKASDHQKASKLHQKAMVANAKAGNDDQAANHARAIKLHDGAAADCAETTTMSENMNANELKTLIADGITSGLKPLSDRITTLESTIATNASAQTEAERDRIIKLFSADGKSPKGADGKDISLDDLKKMDVPTLKLLHANTPVTVPLNARSRTGQTDGVKTYVQRDAAGKVMSVNLAELFNDEAKRNRQYDPDQAVTGAASN